MKGFLYYLLGIATGAVGYHLYNKYFNNMYNGSLYNSYMNDQNQQMQQAQPVYEQQVQYASQPSYVQQNVPKPEPTVYSTGVEPESTAPKYSDRDLELAAERCESDMQSWANTHANDYPEILTPEEAGELPQHVITKTLTFYHDDETLVDDETGQMVDRDITVGDCLEMWDDEYKGTFIDSRKPQLYVVNYHEGVLYDIHRVNGPYYNE